MTTAQTFATASITRESAQALLSAAEAASRDIGIKVTIAVTDAGGHLTALTRHDGAPFLSVNVAIDKAWTAASFGLPTHVWADVIANPQVALVAVGGGMPIVIGGQVVGGIGISGGNAVQDRQAAEIALKSLGFDVTD